jgi:hypothetical protein
MRGVSYVLSAVGDFGSRPFFFCLVLCSLRLSS